MIQLRNMVLVREIALIVLFAWSLVAQPQIVSVVSPVSGRPDFIPGSLFLIAGTNLSVETQAVDPGKALPDRIQGVGVRVGEISAALVSVAPTVIYGQIPADAPLGEATLTLNSPAGDASFGVTV